MAKKAKLSPGSIAKNKRARFEYQLHDKFEAGIVLSGWEVKAIREGRCQLTESFVILHKGEAFLHNCTITPLKTALAHILAEPQRVRKLLLHKRELSRLVNATQAKSYTRYKAQQHHYSDDYPYSSDDNSCYACFNAFWGHWHLL